MVLVDESPGRRPVTALTSGAVLSGSRSVPDILTKHGMPPTPLLPARRAGHPPGGQRSVPSSRELSYLHDTSDTQPMSPGPAYLTPGFSSAVSQVCWLNPYPICAHIDPPPCVQCNRQLNLWPAPRFRERSGHLPARRRATHYSEAWTAGLVGRMFRLSRNGQGSLPLLAGPSATWASLQVCRHRERPHQSCLLAPRRTSCRRRLTPCCWKHRAISGVRCWPSTG